MVMRKGKIKTRFTTQKQKTYEAKLFTLKTRTTLFPLLLFPFFAQRNDFVVAVREKCVCLWGICSYIPFCIFTLMHFLHISGTIKNYSNKCVNELLMN